MEATTVPVLVCMRCAHRWVARNNGRRPAVCPSCKNARWNEPVRDDPNKLNEAEARALKLFQLFHEIVHPTIVRQILRLIESEIRLAGTVPLPDTHMTNTPEDKRVEK